MTRVIHTGDTHIGYRQYHSPERRRDFLSAFQRVVDDAIGDDVDAVVHAGDLFNDRRPDLQDLLGTISILEELRAEDIPFLAIVGNHEDARRGQWLDLFERLGLATHLDDVGTVVGDTAFYGLDYVPKSKREALDYQFEAREASSMALVAHGLFAPFPHGDWDLQAILEAATVDFDAVLLGDDHTPETRQLDDTWVTYCGSTERTSASERDPRGYNIVEFGEDVSITRRGIDTRDFVFIDVELEDSEGSGYIRERIRENSVEDAVVIVTVEGDGESITPAEIEEFGREQGALITRVNDRRKFEDEAAVEVSFADPDDAVRDRIREMGLSDAAQTVDEVVRDDDIARSNVRSRVKDRVQDRIAEPEAFEPVPDPGQESDSSAETPDAVDQAGEPEADSSAPSAGDCPEDDGAHRSEPSTVADTPTVAETETEAKASPAAGPDEAEAMELASEGSDSSDAGSSEESDAEDTTEESVEPKETTMEDFL